MISYLEVLESVEVEDLCGRDIGEIIGIVGQLVENERLLEDFLDFILIGYPEDLSDDEMSAALCDILDASSQDQIELLRKFINHLTVEKK